MSADAEGSVTRWVRDLNAGVNVEAAAEQLWERYFERLVALARAKLRHAHGGAADGEDAALSAFDSFCRGAAAGRYPRLEDREDLWRLLVTITVRRAADQLEHERRQKRGASRRLDEAALAGSASSRALGLDKLPSTQPAPDLSAAIAEDYDRLFGALDNETLRLIALLRLEGRSNDEIAASLDISKRSVERKLNLIRTAWERLS
jgi:DNA-directed RNA polymerase specialized sigma24 family protein